MISDPAFAESVRKLEHGASKYGATVHGTDRFYASSKTCAAFGYVSKKLSLRGRMWICPVCGPELDRDLNASSNEMRQGIVSLESAVDILPEATVRLHPRISCLKAGEHVISMWQKVGLLKLRIAKIP